MSEKKTEQQETPRYGIGEWYGRPLINITGVDRRRLAGETGSRKVTELCPFRQSSTPGATCNKKGGVCTLQSYERKSDGGVTPSARTADLVTVCPSRFWEGNVVFKAIGKALLDCARPTIVKEVGFLESFEEMSDRGVRNNCVVLVNSDSRNFDWCVAEMHASHFSGDSMATEPTMLENSMRKMRLPMWRQPSDLFGYGTNRLMSKLQIMVPTLRRWGKKTAVVLDKPVFNALGNIRPERDLSNADIAWFVVSYAGNDARLAIVETHFTTLERSVEALTISQAASCRQVEDEIRTCLSNKGRATPGTVILLSY